MTMPVMSKIFFKKIVDKPRKVWYNKKAACVEVSKHFGVPSAASFCKRQVPRIMYAVIETGGKQYQVKAEFWAKDCWVW